MVAQGHRCCLQVAAVGVLQVQAHQIDDALLGFFKLGAQKFGSKVACNLHHAFWRIIVDGVKLVTANDVVLNAVLQRLFKKRPRVVQSDTNA